MARNRALHRSIALRAVSRINLSRRLISWMDEIRMPRTALRKRYVRLVHVFHLLDDSCNFRALSDAMYTLLARWEGGTCVNQLLEVCKGHVCQSSKYCVYTQTFTQKFKN